MRCPSCSSENPDGAAFCGDCGTRLNAVCPSCGVANAPTNRFCHGCGMRLAPTPAASTPPPAPVPAVSDRFASPQSYTPKHLVEKILTSKSAIVGERKQVSVLFSDVSGFTAMSERLDPEDVHTIMDRMFEVLLGAVHRYEG